MSQVNGPGEKKPEERRFIREKIVRQPVSKRRILKRLFCIAFVGVLFGVISAVSFVTALPWAQKYIGEETTVESSTITIAKDEPETTAAPETQPVTTETEESEPIEDVLQSVIESYEYSVTDLTSMYGKLSTIVQGADKSIVTVHSVQHETDWFDNPVETSGQYAGAIIADTSQELLILTPQEAVKVADSIKVTFSNGTETNGYVKQQDSLTGMAIVGVAIDGLDEMTLNSAQSLVLGNAFLVKQGDMVAAIGSPIGIVHSSDYGFVSYIRRSVPVTDGVTRVFYSDVRGNPKAGTFLLNSNGELIGWVTAAYNNEQTSNATVFMGISDYKGVLEMMTNGMQIPYMGIQGQMVTEQAAAAGTPSGMYVTASLAEGPAYNAGIQNGDIITAIDGNSLSTLKDYQNRLESLNIGDEVTITVQRNGREHYTELEYKVTIGAR